VLPLRGAEPAGWTPPLEIRKGKEIAVRYRARWSGDFLWVEASHGDGWHTYSLDNTERGKKKTGAPVLGIEKPTVIVVEGGASVNGKWRQSKPKDLSQPDIEWFTWGFEGQCLFAARIKAASTAPLKLRIDAQACKATACAMVDDAEVSVPHSPAASGDAALWSTLLESGDLRDVR
jgi:hypothetical protein